MNLVDSSGWLEYLADGPNAGHFVKPLRAISDLVVPTICLYEVFKVVRRERGEDAALQAVALMRQGKVIDLDSSVALLAAQNSVAHKLPMADSIIFTTAQAYRAIVWTQDNDFEGLPNVRYFSKG